MSQSLFDWDYIVTNCELTPISLYETTMQAYNGPRTISTHALAQNLACTAMTNTNFKKSVAAKFVLLLMIFKISTRDSDPSEHQVLSDLIRETWDDFIRPESPNDVTDFFNEDSI